MSSPRRTSPSRPSNCALHECISPRRQQQRRRGWRAAAAQAAAADPLQQGSLRVGGGGGGSRRDKRGQPNLRVPWAALSYVTCELNYGGQLPTRMIVACVGNADLYRPEVLLADQVMPSRRAARISRRYAAQRSSRRGFIYRSTLSSTLPRYLGSTTTRTSPARQSKRPALDAACLPQPRAAGARRRGG